jgi:hypothetical protein
MFDGALSVQYCPTCAADQMVEIPPCVDGHLDCGDRACTVCGSALSCAVVLSPVICLGEVVAGTRPVSAARRAA